MNRAEEDPSQLQELQPPHTNIFQSSSLPELLPTVRFPLPTIFQIFLLALQWHCNPFTVLGCHLSAPGGLKSSTDYAKGSSLFSTVLHSTPLLLHFSLFLYK